MKKIILLFILLSSKTIWAQIGREITYGVFGGGIYSTMYNLPDVIVPKGIYQGYSLNEEGKFGGAGGFFINWKYPYAKISIQTEILYSGQSTDLKYSDVKGLNYTTTFGYHYINFGTHFKYYPFNGFYVGVGPYVGFNIANNAIEYRSNGQEVSENLGLYFEPDSVVENVLKESLTGKNYFFGMFSLGYEFPSNLSIGARYTHGFTDALTTEENGNRFSENKNIVKSFSLVIGYAFDFENLKNF